MGILRGVSPIRLDPAQSPATRRIAMCCCFQIVSGVTTNRTRGPKTVALRALEVQVQKALPDSRLFKRPVQRPFG